ncbi:hypothetical protein R4K48_14975 [Brachyspira pulli]|uniref:hypothetical protein n=1 Tax=Brachyspira pulli TaxID=310721 RepID=UPI0030052961
MIKKVLLILSVMLFAFSCSSPSNPSGSTGDGGTTGGGTGTTDPSKISAFLNDKTGVYYSKNVNGEFDYSELKIKNSKLYYIDHTYGTKWANTDGISGDTTTTTLFEGDKKITLEGKMSGLLYEYIFNGSDYKMTVYYVLTKETYTSTQLYLAGTISDFAKYAGDYYSGLQLYLQIDAKGNIYFINGGYKTTSDGNTLILTSTDGYIMKVNFGNDRLIAEVCDKNGELYQKLYKSDLVETRQGTYVDSTDRSEVLSIDANGNVKFADANGQIYETRETRLEGNLLTRTEIYNNDTPTEERKITTVRFGTTIEYKDYNNVTKTLIKQ